MGSSGEKRKGRQHLPKVGSPEDERDATRRDREAVEENFGIRPGSVMAKVLGAVLLVVVVVAILALAVWN
jgi:hypothetical protein